MKLRLVIVVLLLVFVLVGAVVLVHHSTHGPLPESPPPAAARAGNPAPVQFPSSVSPLDTNPRTAVAIPPAAVSPQTNHADYARDRVAELQELAMNDDTNSLSIILTELSNPDKEIRSGALEAVVQFDNPVAIPYLKKIATRTKDPAEKAKILEAIEFLGLPPLTGFRPAESTN